jgi:hypothetical protein
MDAWHGRVMDGITLRACMELAPRARKDVSVGQRAVSIASGRTPSSMMKITGGMKDSFACLHGGRVAAKRHIETTTP